MPRGRMPRASRGNLAQRARTSRLLDRAARLFPFAPAAIHRRDAAVAHLLEHVGGERRAEAAAAVEDDVGVGIRVQAFDVALEDAAADVLGSGDVAFAKLAVFAHVDELEPVPAREPRADVRDRDLLDA